jgi:murein DD-endopeptidase MepM/ murein hydrolase activator NlpD
VPINIDPGKPDKTTTSLPPATHPPNVPPPPTWSIGSWGNASIDRWDASFLAAALAVEAKTGMKVDPRVMKAMMDVESGGNGNYPPGKCRSDGSCGPMQIKQQYHQWRCPECDFKTVPGQIELATHIIAHVKDLVSTMGGAGAPPEAKHVDIIDAIMGGAPYTDDYGFKANTDLPYYAYFVGHGGQSNQHTGIDVMASLGLPLYSPINGTVVCAGTGVGAGSYGSSCAAFGYTLGANTGSSGRIEILDDDGKRSLILGHCIRTVVPLGSHVKPGVHVGDLGGMNGPHVHVECRIWDHGNYTIVDPRAAYGKVPYVVPVERVPYNFDPASQPAPNTFTVKALKKLNVYQRADPKAAILDTIEKGETFQAVAMVPGNDGQPWYLGVFNGRVPTEGTDIVP